MPAAASIYVPNGGQKSRQQLCYEPKSAPLGGWYGGEEKAEFGGFREEGN